MATPAAHPDPAEAFEALYRAHVRDVYRYALAVVRDPAEAEDLTQATFLRAWRAFRDGVAPHSPHNWFLRIAHNVLRTHFRDRARRPKQVELPPDLEAPAPSGGPSAAEVLAALSELPLSQREAIVMRELEGRSYAEIAQILGTSKPAVETLIFRARRTLRVRRADLRRIGAVPVPSSLASFFRERGITEGLAALAGAGTAAKAVAVVAAGLVAVGAGKEAVDAVRGSDEIDARVGAVLVERSPGLARATVSRPRAEAPRREPAGAVSARAVPSVPRAMQADATVKKRVRAGGRPAAAGRTIVIGADGIRAAEPAAAPAPQASPRPDGPVAVPSKPSPPGIVKQLPSPVELPPLNDVVPETPAPQPVTVPALPELPELPAPPAPAVPTPPVGGLGG